MSQDPADEPDGPTTPDAGSPPTPAEPSLEALEEAGATEQAHQRARLAEDRLAEVLSAYRQVKIENEGFRDRVTRDVELAFDRRRERLLLKFIEILDNLDRALEAAEQTYAGNPLVEGLILVRTQLLQTLQQEGLERIPVLGLPFDPALTEAVGTLVVSDPEHDHVVVRELMRGYRLRGRVARASRVLLGAYESAAAATPATDDRIGADEAAQSAVETAATVDAADEEAGEPVAAPGAAVLDAALDETTIDESALREIFGERPKRGE